MPAAAPESDALTTPLAWTGTDGNVPGGSWGTSIVDLEKAGVGAGDKVRIRFELGRDGCGGVEGWYVDNVKLVVCKRKGKNREAATAGRSSVAG